MKGIRKHLEILRKIKRKAHHPLVHKLHKKYKISKRTLFYVKEYGPHSNITKTIVRESVKILLLSALISAFGGFAIEQIKIVFVAITPLLILLPALNGMIGGYSTIMSARFSTMLHEGKIKSGLLANKEMKELYAQIMIVSLITAAISSMAAFIISSASGHAASLSYAYKIFAIVLLDVAVLVTILFFLTIAAGIYFYRKKEDPNNFLIPITTSVADFGNMLILAVLVIMLF